MNTNSARFRTGSGRNFVYFICANYQKVAAIKIGYSWNPILRAKSIRRQVKSKIEVLTAIECSSDYEAQYLEKRLHEKFHTLKIKGEWFTPEIQLLSFIDEAKKQELKWLA